MAKIGKKTKSVKKKVAALVVKKSARTKAIKPAKKTGGTQKVSAAAGKRLIANSVGMELIEIPAGKFTMGSPAGEKDRGPTEEQVAVTLTRPFGLGKTEVTQGQWQQVMGTEPWKGEEFVQADKDCPATWVSFFDAVEFCEKLTDLERKAGKLRANEEYRLPTEAEWEYACRAGTTTAFSFGDESKLNSHAWWGGLDIEAASEGEIKAGPGNAAREQYAHKVGLKKPNPWGLHDMHGNVWEWCSDWSGNALPGDTDPVGPEGGSDRVGRGGSWRSNPGNCRSACRTDGDPSLRSNTLGFRVARSQSETVAERRQQGAQAGPAPQVAAAEPPAQRGANSIGMELIEIPAGKFTMGSTKKEEGRGDDEKQVPATITRAFELGKTVVTQKQWIEVMGTTPWDVYEVDDNGHEDPRTPEGDNYPAIEISWDDATEFCKNLTALEHKSGKLPAKQTYRLPTEAEWEYACRAGTTTAHSCGDAESKLGDYAWYNDSSGPELHEVATKKPNPWGLFDMHGNVYEWCEDWYEDSLSGGNDPKGPSAGSVRVLRGGYWYRSASDCRSAVRFGSYPSYRGHVIGFRIVRVLL